MQHKEQVIKVLRKFKEMNPWSGKIKERKAKFLWLNSELNKIYGKNVRLNFDIANRFSEWTFSGDSFYRPITDTIVLKGRLSVVTFLHEWMHVLYGSSEMLAQKYSKALFKEVWPEKYRNLVETRSGMLVKREVFEKSDFIVENVELLE